jgi:hypothetical protein
VSFHWAASSDRQESIVIVVVPPPPAVADEAELPHADTTSAKMAAIIASNLSSLCGLREVNLTEVT